MHTRPPAHTHTYIREREGHACVHVHMHVHTHRHTYIHTCPAATGHFSAAWDTRTTAAATHSWTRLYMHSLTQRCLFWLSWLLILSVENRAAVSCLTVTVFGALRFGLLWSHCECNSSRGDPVRLVWRKYPTTNSLFSSCSLFWPSQFKKRYNKPRNI